MRIQQSAHDQLFGAEIHEIGKLEIRRSQITECLCLEAGMHLRHGFWSALQSLGAMSKRALPVVYSIGLVVALLLAGGFFVLPLYIHFAVPLP